MSDTATEVTGMPLPTCAVAQWPEELMWINGMSIYNAMRDAYTSACDEVVEAHADEVEARYQIKAARWFKALLNDMTADIATVAGYLGVGVDGGEEPAQP